MCVCCRRREPGRVSRRLLPVSAHQGAARQAEAQGWGFHYAEDPPEACLDLWSTKEEQFKLFI